MSAVAGHARSVQLAYERMASAEEIAYMMWAKGVSGEQVTEDVVALYESGADKCRQAQWWMDIEKRQDELPEDYSAREVVQPSLFGEAK